MRVKYIDDHFDNYTIEVDPPKPNRKTSGTGYGFKIPTRYSVALPQESGKAHKRFRVYATCFSNCASLWVQIGDNTYYLNDISRLQDADRLTAAQGRDICQ